MGLDCLQSEARRGKLDELTSWTVQNRSEHSCESTEALQNYSLYRARCRSLGRCTAAGSNVRNLGSSASARNTACACCPARASHAGLTDDSDFAVGPPT